MVEDDDPLVAANAHYTELSSSMYHVWDGFDENAQQTSSSIYFAQNYSGANYGDPLYGNTNVTNTQYADLSDYDKLVFEGSGAYLRVLINRQEDDSFTELNKSFSDGKIEININDYTYFHLNCVKATGAVTLTSMKVYKDDVAYDYTISGSGVKTESVISALADESATAYDATGVSRATELAAVNPNALFVANVGMVTNTSNVIVDDVCASLVLTDGKPFKAPADFTATTATTTRSFNGGLINTVCLPFALSAKQVTALGKFYTLSATQDGDAGVIKFAEVDATAANTPYLFVPTASGVLDLLGVSVVAGSAVTATQGGFSLVGVLNNTAINSDESYEVYGFQADGTPIHLTAETTLKGMRAYLKVAKGGSAKSLRIVFDDDATGIADVQRPNEPALGGQTLFNLAGQRVEKATKGLYIVGGKKVIVK